MSVELLLKWTAKAGVHALGHTLSFYMHCGFSTHHRKICISHELMFYFTKEDIELQKNI